MKTLPTELLEQLLDKESVQAVCEDLAHVCREKADHVATNWQDKELAKLWEQSAMRFDDMAEWARATGHPSFRRN